MTSDHAKIFTIQVSGLIADVSNNTRKSQGAWNNRALTLHRIIIWNADGPRAYLL